MTETNAKKTIEKTIRNGLGEYYQEGDEESDK